MVALYSIAIQSNELHRKFTIQLKFYYLDFVSPKNHQYKLLFSTRFQQLLLNKDYSKGNNKIKSVFSTNMGAYMV